MKFELIGIITYWDSIHKDGYPGSEKVQEDFDADDATAASTIAKEILEKRTSRYPISHHSGLKEFTGCRAELRQVISVEKFVVVEQETTSQVTVVKKELRLTSIQGER